MKAENAVKISWRRWRTRGASPHTLAAHRRDLAQFFNYYAGSYAGRIPAHIEGEWPEVEVEAVQRLDVRGFLRPVGASSRPSLNRSWGAEGVLSALLQGDGAEAAPTDGIRLRACRAACPAFWPRMMSRVCSISAPPPPALSRDWAIMEPYTHRHARGHAGGHRSSTIFPPRSTGCG
ncbi:hypothetical protein HS125_00180 [bacterium]|nr:hypothetical protein [bacterium]